MNYSMQVCIRFGESAKPTEKCIQVCKGGKLEKCSVMNVKAVLCWSAVKRNPTSKIREPQVRR